MKDALDLLTRDILVAGTNRLAKMFTWFTNLFRVNSLALAA